MYPIKLYFKHLPNLITLILSFLINIATWSWLLWQIKPQGEPIFLHYNILFGVDYVGEWIKILYIPLAGLMIFLVNAILGWILFSRDKFVSQILNTFGLICQLFLFIASALLVFLNV